MKLILCFGLAMLALFAAVSNRASAEVIAETFSGPGGTGHDGEIGGFGPDFIAPVLDFTSVNYIDVTVTVDEATIFLVEASFGSVKNDTGLTWSGFTLENETPNMGSLLGDWLEADSPRKFTLVGDSATDVSFSTLGGGPGVANGGFFLPQGNYSATGAGTITIREFPTAVPEPNSILLAIFATAGLSMFSRRRSELHQSSSFSVLPQNVSAVAPH